MALLIDGDGAAVYDTAPISGAFLSSDVSLDQVAPGHWVIATSGGGGGSLWWPTSPAVAAADAVSQTVPLTTVAGGGAAAAVASGGAAAGLLPSLSRLVTSLPGPAVAPSTAVSVPAAAGISAWWWMAGAAVIGVVLVTRGDR